MGEAYKFTGAKLPARNLTFIGSLVQAIQLYGIFEDSSTLILFHNGSWIYFADRNTFWFIEEAIRWAFFTRNFQIDIALWIVAHEQHTSNTFITIY